MTTDSQGRVKYKAVSTNTITLNASLYNHIFIEITDYSGSYGDSNVQFNINSKWVAMPTQKNGSITGSKADIQLFGQVLTPNADFTFQLKNGNNAGQFSIMNLWLEKI